MFEFRSAAVVAVPVPEHKQLPSFLNDAVGLLNKHRFPCRAASVWRIIKLLCGKKKRGVGGVCVCSGCGGGGVWGGGGG